MRIRSLVLAAAAAATIAPPSAGAADYVFWARLASITSASTATPPAPEMPPVPEAPVPKVPAPAGTFSFRPGETYRTSRPLAEVLASVPNREVAKSLSRNLVWRTSSSSVTAQFRLSSEFAADAVALVAALEKYAPTLSATFELDAAGHLVVTRYGTLASGALVFSDKVDGSTVAAFDFVAP